MPVLSLNIGDGLHFTQESKLGVNIDANNITIDGDGITVDNLNGQDGTIGGTEPDEWTIVKGRGLNRADPANPLDENSFVDINREVTNLIFTYII